MKQIVVHKGRTVIVPVSLGIDVSQDTITSEIRRYTSQDSELLATWAVTFATDGFDGELILTLDNSATVGVTRAIGYMDLKRVSGGEPISVFEEPIQVLFKDSVTA